VRAKNPATLGWKRSEKKSYRVQISGFNSLPMAGKMRFSLRFDMGLGKKMSPEIVVQCFSRHQIDWLVEIVPRLGKKHWRS